jgi:hypothetical protein
MREQLRASVGQTSNSALFAVRADTHQTDSIKRAFARILGRRALESDDARILGQKMEVQLKIGSDQDCPSA